MRREWSVHACVCAYYPSHQRGDLLPPRGGRCWFLRRSVSGVPLPLVHRNCCRRVVRSFAAVPRFIGHGRCHHKSIVACRLRSYSLPAACHPAYAAEASRGLVIKKSGSNRVCSGFRHGERPTNTGHTLPGSQWCSNHTNPNWLSIRSGEKVYFFCFET